MPVPDARLDYPIQRWFNASPGGRRYDAFGDIGRRVAALEAAYSIQMHQHGLSVVPDEATITSTGTTPASAGGPSVKVNVPSESAIILFYFEFDLYVTHATSVTVAAFLHEATYLSAPLAAGRYINVPTAAWQEAITGPRAGLADLATTAPAQGRSPRGSRGVCLTGWPPGDYTFELRWQREAATTMKVRDRRLWVDVI